MGEIVSLQFGDWANLIGAHFWNTQVRVKEWCKDEEIEVGELLPRQILHHASLEFNVERYVPRVVLVGQALPVGCTKTLMDMPTITTWGGQLDVHVQKPRSELSHGQEKEPNWKDVSVVPYHDRSPHLASLNGLVTPSVDAVMEDVRYFAEACDNFQGFHISFDKSGEWGSLLKGSMNALRDLYPKKSILTFLLNPDGLLDSKLQQLVQNVLSLSCTLDASDLVIPLSSGNSEIGKHVPSLETAQISALLMDNATLPYRCHRAYRTASSDLRSFCEVYSASASTHLVSVSCISGFNVHRFLTHSPAVEASTAHALWQSCCDWMSAWDTSIQAEHVTLRGLPSAYSQAVDQAKDALLRCLSREGIRRLCRCCVVPNALPLQDPSLPPQTCQPHTLVLLTRLMSSKKLNQQTAQLCTDFSNKRRSLPIQQALELWDADLSDIERLSEAVTESQTPLNDAASS